MGDPAVHVVMPYTNRNKCFKIYDTGKEKN